MKDMRRTIVRRGIYLFISVLCSAFLIHCEDESCEAISRPFTWNLTSESAPSIYPGDRVDINIEFKPALGFSGYKWKYSSPSNSGALMLGEQALAPNTLYDLADVQTLALRYSNSQTGPQELTFTAVGPNGREETIRVPVAFKKPDYKVDLLSERSINAQPDKPTPISFKVTGLAGASNLKTLSYTSDLDGRLSYEGQLYNPGDIINIGTEEDISLHFTPDGVGTGELVFTFANKNGETERVPIPIDVKNQEFTWILLTLEERTAYPNEPVDIDIEFASPPDLSGYRWKYNSSSSSGKLMSGERELVADNLYDLSANHPLSLRYRDSQTGLQNLTFTLTHPDIDDEPLAVALTIKNPRYKVELAPPDKKVALRAEASDLIAFKIDNTDGINVPKTVSYTSDLGGSISYGGNTYNPGDEIPIGQQTDVSFTFTPGRLGTGELVFTFADENGRAEEIKVPVVVESNEIAVSLEPSEGPAYDNHSKDIRIAVTPNLNRDVSKYKIKYSVKNENDIVDRLTDANGVEIPLGEFKPLDQFQQTIRLKSKPFRGGEVVITATVKEDEYGKEIENDVSVTVINRETITRISSGDLYGMDRKGQTRNFAVTFRIEPDSAPFDDIRMSINYSNKEVFKVDAVSGTVEYQKFYTVEEFFTDRKGWPFSRDFILTELKDGSYDIGIGVTTDRVATGD